MCGCLEANKEKLFEVLIPRLRVESACHAEEPSIAFGASDGNMGVGGSELDVAVFFLIEVGAVQIEAEKAGEFIARLFEVIWM